jgi:hypothetical protein
MVADVWTKKYTLDSVPQWDLWVHKLASNLTSTLGNDSSVLLRKGESHCKNQGLTLEATGFFYHDGYWYITWGETVQNGAGDVYYPYAQNPLRP